LRFLLILLSFVDGFPSASFDVESQHINEVFCLIRDIATIDVHLILDGNSAVRVKTRHLSLGRYGPPLLSDEVIDIDHAVGLASGDFPSKDDEFLFMSDSGVALQFYLLSVTGVVLLLPYVLVTLLRNIHLVEIANDALIDIVSTMHEQGIAEHHSHMIGSTGNILALDLDLRPSVIKRVLQLSLDDQVLTLLLDQS
jgi:hypothetical protein